VNNLLLSGQPPTRSTPRRPKLANEIRFLFY
jgi:hypothetical protein